jgi:hypothetical protein
MPVEVSGVLDTIKAMRRFDPDLLAQMNTEIRGIMIPLRDKARAYAPSANELGSGLYNWVENSPGKTITARNSMFRTFNTEGRVRIFPLYDQATVVKGIKYSQAPSKRNKQGFRALYYIYNASAAGAIYETAGRAKVPSKKKYRSNNPEAGKHFVSRMGPLYGEKERGRMIYRAGYESQGKIQDAVIKAVSKNIAAFNVGTSFNKSSYVLAA